jgi:hypothetical protein
MLKPEEQVQADRHTGEGEAGKVDRWQQVMDHGTLWWVRSVEGSSTQCLHVPTEQVRGGGGCGGQWRAGKVDRNLHYDEQRCRQQHQIPFPWAAQGTYGQQANPSYHTNEQQLKGHVPLL